MPCVAPTRFKLLTGTTFITTSTTSNSGGPAAKASANEASGEELTAPFESAGIPSAERWTEEVEEYRSYPEDDPNVGRQ